MLEICVIFALFGFLINVICEPCSKKIKNSTTIKEALHYRKKLLLIRWIFTILFLVLYVGVAMLVNGYDFWIAGNGQYILPALLMYLITFNGFKKLKGNVSILTKDSFLKRHSRFALFLRGFQDDNYKLEEFVQIDNDTFSEQFFIKELNQFIPSVAIGMTKEVNSPWGANRIYVSDDTWKEDVSELILKAEYIFVLLNDRPSCIWEIEQLETMLYKTYFFIEDIEKYNAVKVKLNGCIEFPEIECLNVNIPFHLHMGNGMSVTSSYSSSKDGYKAVISAIFAEQIKRNESEIKGYRNFLRGFWLTVALGVLASLNYKFSYAILLSINIESVWGASVLTFILLCIEWLVYMLFKVRIKAKRNLRNQS